MKCKFCRSAMKCINDDGSFRQEHITWDLYECTVCGATVDETVKYNIEKREWKPGKALTDVIAELVKWKLENEVSE